MTVAVQQLRVSLADFWAMTPREWCALTDAEIDAGRRRRGLPDTRQLARLDQIGREAIEKERQAQQRKEA